LKADDQGVQGGGAERWGGDHQVLIRTTTRRRGRIWRHRDAANRKNEINLNCCFSTETVIVKIIIYKITITKIRLNF
jgi:hypothetical protein